MDEQDLLLEKQKLRNHRIKNSRQKGKFMSDEDYDGHYDLDDYEYENRKMMSLKESKIIKTIPASNL